MPKKEKPVVAEVEDVLPNDDVVDVLPILPDAPVAEPGAIPVGGKRIGVKEPIPFKWKIIGSSGRYILTLFKSVEREDADAQIERLQKDSYYTDLRVVDINEKIEQPVVKEPKRTKPDKLAKPEKMPGPAKQSKGAFAEKAKPSSAVSASRKGTLVKKPAPKPAVRSTPAKSKSSPAKKPVAAKSASKTVAKKK